MKFDNLIWDSNNRKSYIKYLDSLEDLEYKKFHSGIVNTKLDIIGIRMPILKNIAKYINSIEDELYIISVSAYTLKLEANKTINKYDLLNNGNLGKNGEKKIIKEIEENCKKNKCVFLIDVRELNGTAKTQYNKEIIKYIETTYWQTGSIGKYNLAIYRNY